MILFKIKKNKKKLALPLSRIISIVGIKEICFKSVFNIYIYIYEIKNHFKKVIHRMPMCRFF